MAIPDGALIVNKPQGPTSHDVVLTARQAFGLRRIGHGGTLDPIATGVLVLLVGRATKRQQFVHGARKVYDTVIRFGQQTDTGDAWGAVIAQAPPPDLQDRLRLENALASCRGTLLQQPPAFSAVKVQGHPLYWWARRGQPKSAPARPVTIFALELLEVGEDRLRCRVECSAGTYVRSLAERIAAQLGSVGHVTELVRLSVGPWRLEDACAYDWLRQASREELIARLRPVELPDAVVPRV